MPHHNPTQLPRPPRELEAQIGYCFHNPQLLLEALTHKSCKLAYSNERLEFLGDAVLDMLVGEYLFERFPRANEGELSKLRACIVNEKGFMHLANLLNLGDFLLISASEERNKGRNKPSILSNAFEALIGAMYLESLDSIKHIKALVYGLLERQYTKIDLDSLFMDYKTALQELTQALYGEIPSYMLTDERGPDHNKHFEIALIVQGRELARASGTSKKDAQQKAAKIAYTMLTESKRKSQAQDSHNNEDKKRAKAPAKVSSTRESQPKQSVKAPAQAKARDSKAREFQTQDSKAQDSKPQDSKRAPKRAQSPKQAAKPPKGGKR